MIRDLTLADTLYVCQNMREMDRACIEAAIGEFEVEDFAATRWKAYGPAWTLTDGHAPVAIFGISFSTEWIGTAWLICTNEMTPGLWRKLMRFCIRVRGNALDPNNEHRLGRIEAYVLGAWKEADSFARRLGFELEGVRRRAGRNGEDFRVFSIVGD